MSITLSEGETKRLDVGLTPLPPEPATLYGKVTDADTGSGVSGATVSITGPGGSYSDTTDYGGNYRIEGIVPGTYSGLVIHPDYEDYAF